MSSTFPPMYGAGAFNGTNITSYLYRTYSPVTLNNEWPKMTRLIIVLVCSCFGSIMNGFFVAAFFVEKSLRKVGNVFLACVGLADMLITGAVMPISAVVLLSGEWDSVVVCGIVQLLAEIATYSYSLYFMFVAADVYFRICRSTAVYKAFVSIPIGLVALSIFILSCALASVGVYLELDYDYCERKHFGHFYYRIITTVAFYMIPSIVTVYGLISACVQVRRRARRQIQYKRSHQYEHDYSLTVLNIVAYTLFLVSWIPYLILAQEYPDASDPKFYSRVWLGVSRSVLTSFLYGTISRNFRRAFAHLLNYCCCKSTLSSSSGRHLRRGEHKNPIGDVWVHVMHQAVNTNSPHRGTNIRETQGL